MNTFTKKYDGPDAERGMNQYEAVMFDKTHSIMNNQNVMPRTSHYYQQAGTSKEEFLVPEGHYFVMGDNRDNSLDGRFWGFVPEENLVGQAVAIWISFDFERTEDGILPTWVPSNIRFDRIGAIN